MQRERKRDKGKGRVQSAMKLGLQALSVPARHQLILLSFHELQRCVTSVHRGEKSATAWKQEVFGIVVDTYKAVGKQWLGYEPIYLTQDLTLWREEREAEDVDEDDLERGERRSHDGEWHLIEEKLPIYATVVKYMSLTSKRLGDTSTLTEAETAPWNDWRLDPASAEGAVLTPEMKEMGSSWSYGIRGGCVIAASSEIVEDMVLNIAELVTLEYLTHLANGRSVLTDGMLTDGWPLALHSSLHNTRTLERFRNQVFFGWWLHRNISSVIAIFEDYHFLWGIQHGKLELSQLKGLRLAVSYFLELFDAVEPLLKSFLRRVGDILSFFLVTLIGRSLGLILKGIQSSVQIPWGKPNKP